MLPLKGIFHFPPFYPGKEASSRGILAATHENEKPVFFLKTTSHPFMCKCMPDLDKKKFIQLKIYLVIEPEGPDINATNKIWKGCGGRGIITR